jgi:hypothetical protein
VAEIGHQIALVKALTGALRPPGCLTSTATRHAPCPRGKPSAAAGRAGRDRNGRIRAAISTIAAQDDTLARHLRNTIRTGRLCSYQPEEAVSWRT